MKNKNKYKKYSLEPYSGSESRHECPNCGDEKSYTYYIDTETGRKLYGAGRCKHEFSCGFHQTPKEYFNEIIYFDHKNLESFNVKPFSSIDTTVSVFDWNHLIETITNPHENNLILFLMSKYDHSTVKQIIEMYHVGTSNYWNYSTIFWYVNLNNEVSSGKVMKYNRENGKRVKSNDGSPLINSMRSILMKEEFINPDFHQKTGLYGEHLLQVNTNDSICVVESEKTALIAMIHFPNYIWLATGGSISLSDERLQVLKGKNVILYPSNNSFELWNKIASKYNFEISTLVREECSIPNADIADYLLSIYGKQKSSYE